MDRVVDIERVRLELQSDFLADGEFAAHAHVQIGIVRSKQPVGGRARNVAFRVIRRVHKRRLVEVGGAVDIRAVASERAILPHASGKAGL